MDFMMVSVRHDKNKVAEIFPKFIINNTSKDLMIRGGDFYAIWDPGKNMWSTEEDTAIKLIDAELDKFAADYKEHADGPVKVMHMWDSDTGSIDKWHKYLQKQSRDNYHQLDTRLVFANEEVTKEDYCTKRLKYPLEAGPHKAWDELMSVLYSPEERQKIEWAIGSIVEGDSKYIQKFLVLYGSAGTGKSTVLNVIQQLFDGYYTVFDAKALGSGHDAFALEQFRSNPLVAIQHDGDLSKIEDNTRLNSLVSHEIMTVNEKYKATYQNRFDCFLFMGTNKPVKITDAKSGLIRRLIDVSPTGNTLPPSRYKTVTNKIKFELGGIADYCREVYRANKSAYDNYIPVNMLGASNDFYNFVLDCYDIFKRDNGISLRSAWTMYKDYCDEASIQYPLNMRIFKEELKNYFRSFTERLRNGRDSSVYNYYEGFLTNKFLSDKPEDAVDSEDWLTMQTIPSVFDLECQDCPAQYCKEDGTPKRKWENVDTTLKDLSTWELHYVKVPENHIVIDFDLKDADGNKSAELNLMAASKFPKTYAEFSKSGAGVHLHYIYDGDPSKLSCLYDTGIEIKVFTGGASLRRKLSKCNAEPIAKINSGLPLKDVKGEDMVDYKLVKNEKILRSRIVRTMNKEFHAGTKPAVDFIYDLLERAYKSGIPYDVTDMRPAIDAFANGSTHHADYCLKLVDKMHFKSDEMYESLSTYAKDTLIFFDVEVFPNLFVLCWKAEGSDFVNAMINPSPEEIEELTHHKLVGFNNRKYDNHILYARMQHYTIPQLYTLSNRIVNSNSKGDPNCFFGQAYNLSYTDIYDFSSKKQSLKKFEIELGIHHQELGLPWDQPVEPSKWELVGEYCMNDVVATEAVWKARAGDFLARQILADLAGMTVNDTTNQLTTRIIFGNEKHPQSKFRYRNLAEPVSEIDPEMKAFINKKTSVQMPFSADSILPYFPGYEFDPNVGKTGESKYAGEVVGEGGYVFANTGMYGKCKVFDVASMHPHSITSEYLFGVYTERFNDLMEARVAIKHGDYDKAGELFDGKLKKYLTDSSTAKALAGALKIAINSVYGLTAASFDHPFHDPRNVDNIVAKRGALFMITLKNAVLAKGYKVVHCKTDSIKISNPDAEIEKFILDFGNKYGYQFEVENVFDRVCLVNDAVFVAKTASDDPESPNEWTATGKQFAVPYVFKTLFSHEPITFDDQTVTFSVNSALYLDMNEGMPEDEHDYKFVGKVGSFCPMKPGVGGGILLRQKDDKYDSANGAKGYRWMEAETVNQLGLTDSIDTSYFIKLVDEAKDTISQFGDFDKFVAEGSYQEDDLGFLNIPEGYDEESVPFDEVKF